MNMKMMRLASIISVLALFSVAKLSAADPGKETTITGNAVCAKCALNETKECQNVVQVVENGKTNNVYLEQNDVSKKFHDDICTSGGEKVAATGTVTKKDGKAVMTASRIEPMK